MKNKKKIIVLTSMIALLVVTAVFNFILTADGATATDSAVITSANYFTQYKAERLSTRNDEFLQLDAIIASKESSGADVNNAVSLKTQLTKITEQELLIESLIKAYGFEDVVVVIGLDSENVNVIAKTNELTTDDAILIYSIINEECVTAPENVKIIPIS